MSFIMNIGRKVLPKSTKIRIKKMIAPILMRVKQIKYKKEFIDIQNHYRDVIKDIKQHDSIRFGMYVVYDSSFGGYELFELLRDNPRYDVKIAIIPDTSRGDFNLHNQYLRTKNFFIEKYGEEYIVDGFVNEKFIDLSDQFDIVYFANPYDAMVNHLHTIQYASSKNILPIYICYSSAPDRYGPSFVMPLWEQSLLWMIFANNQEQYNYYRKNQLFKGRNVVISGYAKMDSYFKAKENSEKSNPEKKTIIIAPHHTVAYDALPLSNFIAYSELFLKLPDMFPSVHFIFRPHPLLFTNLVNNKMWTQRDVEAYLSKLSGKGVEYSVGGDYFEVFAASDAMIHDCCSFLAEYIYTGKPCCYMLRSRKTKKIFSPLGISCLKCYTKAYCENDIVEFIQKIVASDTLSDGITYPPKIYAKLKTDMMSFYPYSSEHIIELIESELLKE